MKCLIVYYLDGRWYGEEVEWKRSGSGTYREITRIEVPQSREDIEAALNEAPKSATVADLPVAPAVFRPHRQRRRRR